jgi:hypothetical protein
LELQAKLPIFSTGYKRAFTANDRQILHEAPSMIVLSQVPKLPNEGAEVNAVQLFATKDMSQANEQRFPENDTKGQLITRAILNT